jgi:hypothetical protein
VRTSVGGGGWGERGARERARGREADDKGKRIKAAVKRESENDGQERQVKGNLRSLII